MVSRKIQIFLVIMMCGVSIHSNIFAKEQIISPLPTPTQEIVDTSIKKCSKSCLNNLFETGQYFSFIALYSGTKDKALREKFQAASSILDSIILPPLTDSKNGVRIALMMPQKDIGRYSMTSVDSILTYLIARGGNFEFKVFDSQNEEIENLITQYNKAQEENYDYVIAILTSKGLTNLLENIEITTPLFIPTINQKQAAQFAQNKNVFFGGIDYDKQMDMMIKLADSKNATLIGLNDDKAVGKMLGELLNTKSQNLIIQEEITQQKTTNFKQSFAKIRANIKNSMIILNTSVIKSGLIIPQIANTKVLPIAFLSSQMNYNPSLLGLMPKEDTKRLFIVNAISPINTKLLAFSELMNADLQYDWVNYATALAIDILLAYNDKGHTRFFTEKLQNNQVIYHNKFYGVKDSHFIPVKLR